MNEIDHQDLLRALGLQSHPDPLEVLRNEVARCSSRNYNEEGIPMFLVLQDVDGKPAPSVGDPAGNTRLSAAVGLVLEAIDAPEVGAAEIAAAMEVVADRWLYLGVPQADEAVAPNTGAE